MISDVTTTGLHLVFQCRRLELVQNGPLKLDTEEVHDVCVRVEMMRYVG